MRMKEMRAMTVRRTDCLRGHPLRIYNLAL
jgi:hypothetical protein